MEYITLLTKDHKSMTAGLHYIEGELMNIVVQDVTGIQAGDRVTCFFNNKSFHAFVLKKEDYNLYLYLSLHEANAPNERRRFYRHPCEIKGILSTPKASRMPINVVDISINGFGFIASVPLKTDTIYELQFSIDEERSIRANVKLRNMSELPASLFRYGSEIHFISQEGLLALRKYLLQHQLMRAE